MSLCSKRVRHGRAHWVWQPDVDVDGSSARLSASEETQEKTKRETELN